eukprot:TRINITY_DN7969_c0_g1_i3.p1 TRINITY_DN7969_c0_g1~~TRINITY_DN7969_c0_g1_i3.p1  ORF type:complete len:182 (+),score=23.41 TRINITY_DN7969_c0_g1_i3:252-797(+)
MSWNPIDWWRHRQIQAVQDEIAPAPPQPTQPPSAARRAADFIPNRTRASSLTVDPTQPIEATVYTGPRVQAAQIALQPAQPAAAPIPPARQCKCGAPLHAPQDEQLVRCAQCGKVSQLRSGSGSVGSVEAMVPGMVHVNCPACSTLLAYAQREIPEAHCTCLLYTSPSPRDRTRSRMPSSA